MQKSTTASLEDDLARISALANRSVEHPHELASYLRQIYHAVFDVDFARYDAGGHQAAVRRPDEADLRRPHAARAIALPNGEARAS